MESDDLKEIRDLFERAEREEDLDVKLAALRDAISTFASFTADSSSDAGDVAIAKNLHDTYLRRITKQIASAKKMNGSTFYGYLSLLLFKPNFHTKQLLSNDPDMSDAYAKLWERYQGFVRL